MLTTIRLLAFLTVFLCAAPTSAHSPPPIYLEFGVDDEQMVLRALLEPIPFAAWIGIEIKEPKLLTEEEREKIRTGAEAFFAKVLEVRIDGVPVKTKFREYEKVSMLVHFEPDLYGRLVMSYGVKGKPRQASVRWLAFEGVLSWLLRVEGEIKGYGDVAYVGLTAEEPEYVWHPPRGPRIPPSVREPDLYRPPTVGVPLVSAALLVAALVFLPVSFLLRLRPRHRWLGVGAALVLVLALSGVARTEMRPPWVSRFKLPDEEGARFIFETLHRNIYRSFDYESESDIYDTLARSVRGELLEEVYAEVYESLILRDQGGVVCRIQDVTITECEIELPADEDALRFLAKARWRVRGTVRHYGHVHVRVNEYRAEYTVGRDEEGWKIIDVEILEQERVE
ncbi:MAG: hypothetical protein ACYS99_08130 [Planctomycetota bacterium]|jgi:hypothetical protein